MIAEVKFRMLEWIKKSGNLELFGYTYYAMNLTLISLVFSPKIQCSYCSIVK